MKKKKSLSGLILAVVLAMAFVLLMSGCGGKDQEDTDEAEKSQESQGTAASTAVEKLEPVTLIYYYPGNVQKDLKLVNDAINVILKEKINATIELKTIDWGSYEQKMNVINASGEEYDLSYTTSWINNYWQNVSKGTLVPLDELLDKYAPQLKASFPEEVWNAARVDGKIYGTLNKQIYATPYGVMVRKDMADKYGLDINTVNRYEDLEPFLQKVKDNEKEMLPIAADALYNPFISVMYGYDAVGDQTSPGYVKLDDPDLKVVNQYESQEYKDWVTTARKWYLAGYLDKDAASVKDLTGEYAAHIGGIVIKPGMGAELKAKWGYEFVYKALTKPYITTGSIVSVTGISKTSKNPERAMMFLELINTDKELYNLLCHGIEGKHYVLHDNNVIGFPDGVTAETSTYRPTTDWMFGNQFNSYYVDQSQVGVWEETDKLNKEGVVSPLLGFNFVSDPVNTEIAQVQSVLAEFNLPLLTGSVDPEKYLPQFLEKLKAAGVDKIIAEKQKQIDAWKATK